MEEQEADPPRCEQTPEEIDAILRAAEEEPFHAAGAMGPGGVGLGAAGGRGFVGDSEIDSEIDALHDEHPSLFDTPMG